VLNGFLLRPLLGYGFLKYTMFPIQPDFYAPNFQKKNALAVILCRFMTLATPHLLINKLSIVMALG